MHGPHALWHYGTWLRTEHPEDVTGFYAAREGDGLNDEGGGDTGAPEVAFNPRPARALPHRLGRRPHDRAGSTRSPATTTGSSG